MRVTGWQTLARNESEGAPPPWRRCLGRRRGRPCPARAALSTDHDSLMKDSSVSTDVGTRKMVNYA